MFRWLEVGDGQWHDRVTGAFTDRMAAYRRLPPNRQDAVAASLVLTWRDFLDAAGSLEAFRTMDRERQKHLITRLVDHEARAYADGNEAEAISAALISFWLASVAAHDTEALDLMAAPLNDLGRRIDTGFTLGG
jgi:hypothetical protein